MVQAAIYKEKVLFIYLLIYLFIYSWDRTSWYISTVKPTRRATFEFIEYQSAC